MMDLWLFSESKLRTKFDTIRHCEERSDVATHLSPFHNTCPLIQYRAIIKKRKCPNIWSSPRFWLLSYTDTRPLQCIRLGRSFFSLLLIKVRKNCNNSADNCCCTCNNSNKPVNIHCKASSYSNSGNPVECGRQPALIKEPLKKIVHRDYFLGSSTINAHLIYQVPVQAFSITAFYH